MKSLVKRNGDTVVFENKPFVVASESFVGKKEKSGPLHEYFKHYQNDTVFCKQTYEQAESELVKRAFELATKSLKQKPEIVFCGDLQNQCAATTFGLRESGIAHVGLYGACSTMAESLALASNFVACSVYDSACALASSHFCTAERQFRTPLEYGGRRVPPAQWTATASGCVVVSRQKPNDKAVTVDGFRFGKIVDFGICDVNNMGGAMAPAAADSYIGFFDESKTSPDDYDFIVTGDLGKVGSRLFLELMSKNGYDVHNHLDCGLLIFDVNEKGVNSGGSGAGCSAAVLASYFIPKLQNKKFKKIVFAATGALMNVTTFQQKQSIPSIAHIVVLSAN